MNEITAYSAVPNNCTVWNNRGGYYIGLFEHYIKNHVLFNNFFLKQIQKKIIIIIVPVQLFGTAEYDLLLLVFDGSFCKNSDILIASNSSV